VHVDKVFKLKPHQYFYSDLIIFLGCELMTLIQD